MCSIQYQHAGQLVDIVGHCLVLECGMIPIPLTFRGLLESQERPRELLSQTVHVKKLVFVECHVDLPLNLHKTPEGVSTI